MLIYVLFRIQVLQEYWVLTAKAGPGAVRVVSFSINSHERTNRTEFVALIM